ncbi:MAG: hypothetical protein H3C43_02940, partial [Leptonema sp. (in: Bacteria)]|nr:hypothetical protein [Leptonema sp. (in: bacteria)]
NAPKALFAALQSLNQRFIGSVNDFYRQRWVDFEDAGRSALDKLIGMSYENHCLEQFKAVGDLPVVVAVDLAPALYLKIPKPAAILLRDGGLSSHLALLAANQGIPILVQLEPKNDFDKIEDQNWIEIHNNTCAIYSEGYHKELISKEAVTTHSVHSATQKSEVVLSNGQKIRLSINADDSVTISEHSKRYQVSVGLFRTEFLYLRDHELLTNEEKAIAAYSEVFESTGYKSSITFRLIDVDDDKFSAHFYSQQSHRNRRGIDYYKVEPTILRTQIRAILKAAVHYETELRVMVPMIRNLDDWFYIESILNDEKRQINKQTNIQFGAMIELPSALFSAEQLQDSVDFLSLGTNDLLRYSIGQNRSAANSSDIYEPAFFRMLYYGLRRVQKEISICGMLGANPEFLSLFLELGVTNFSVPVNQFEKIKEVLRQIDPTRQLLLDILRLHTRQEVEDFLKSELPYFNVKNS